MSDCRSIAAVVRALRRAAVLLAFAASPAELPAWIRPARRSFRLEPPRRRLPRTAALARRGDRAGVALIGLAAARLVPDASAARDAGRAVAAALRSGASVRRPRRRRAGAGGGGPAAAGGAAAAARAPSTVGIAIATRADLPVVLDALGTVTPVDHGDACGRRSRA